MLNLAATDPNATAYAWVINGFISLIPPVASPVVNFETLLSTLNNPTNITITLTLSYTLNGVTGTDVKTGVVPTQSLEAQVNGTPFQPTYNA